MTDRDQYKQSSRIFKLTFEELQNLMRAADKPYFYNEHGEPAMTQQEQCDQVWKQVAERIKEQTGLTVILNTIGQAPGKEADYFMCEVLEVIT